MIQKEFVKQAIHILRDDQFVTGLAAGGSWLSGNMDEFSDVDLVLVTRDRISHDKNKMVQYAEKLGTLLSAFTGEHVGEPRLLICLYEEPFLHVDIKFLIIEELATRIEDPAILFDRDDQLADALRITSAVPPYPDFQWIEDRFWTWIHYALTKIGRGEYFETYDFLGFLRTTVFAPLLHIKNGLQPKALRRIETSLRPGDLELLKSTIAAYDRNSLLLAVEKSVEIYRDLRKALYHDITLKMAAEQRVLQYLQEIKQRA